MKKRYLVTYRLAGATRKCVSLRLEAESNRIHLAQIWKVDPDEIEILSIGWFDPREQSRIQNPQRGR